MRSFLDRDYVPAASASNIAGEAANKPPPSRLVHPAQDNCATNTASAHPDYYQYIFGDQVREVLQHLKGAFPSLYSKMRESEDLGRGASQGKLKADKRTQAIESMVENVVSQMRVSLQSEKVKVAMDAHMGSLRPQMQRGVEDMFQLAGRSVTSADSRSGIRSHSLPFKLQGGSRSLNKKKKPN